MFLRQSAILGMATSLPVLVAACGSGEDEAPGGRVEPRSRETRALHFDLSSAPIVAPRLQLFKSRKHNAMLSIHDDASRARYRALSPELAAIPDQRLTHYIEDADLPAGALQIANVRGTHPATGAAVMTGPFLHVPSTTLQKIAARRIAAGKPVRSLSAKLRAYGVSAGSLGSSPSDATLAFNSTPWDVATALVFQHPSITNLNPDLGGDIIDRIQSLPCDTDSCYPYLSSVAQMVGRMIDEHGYPSTTNTGSWATLKPLVDQDTGQVQHDDTGAITYTFVINDALSDAVGTVVTHVLDDINDDPLFEGTNWQPSDGGAPHIGNLAGAPRLGASPFTVRSSIAVGKRKGGIRLSDVTSDAGRNVTLTFQNEFLRSVGIFAEYFDAADKHVDTGLHVPADTSRSTFLGVVGPDKQLMGIPLLDSNAPKTTMRFQLPDAASYAKIRYASLGFGGDPFAEEPMLGAVHTTVLGIGLPTIFLTLGIYVTFQDGIAAAVAKALYDPQIMTLIIRAVVLGSVSLGTGTSAAITTKDATSLMVALGNIGIQVLLKSCPAIGVAIASAATASDAAQAVPFLGVAMWALATAASAAKIGETVIECVSNPMIEENRIALAMDSTVRIHRDPSDFRFPATATTFVVSVNYYGGATPIVYTGSVPVNQTDPIEVQLHTVGADGAVTPGVASGGAVRASVALYNDADCLVGTGSTGWFNNVPDPSTNSLVIDLTIQELLVQLNASTTYRHQSKLAYIAGARAWQPTAVAPVTTVAASCQGNDGAICALHGLTVQTSSGLAGYGYTASGTALSLCDGGSSSTASVAQTISLGPNPEDGASRSACTTVSPIGVVFDAVGSGPGGHSFSLQVTADPSAFALTSFGPQGPASQIWGHFSSALDSLCVTSNGYVVGVNRETHKLETLRLPAAPTNGEPADLASSSPFSTLKSGKGVRAGLVDTPVAVAALNSTVLVLEQGNRRVQAFEPEGTTSAIFKDANGQPTSILQLKDEPDAFYLDIAVEGKGYVYVLSYIGGGSSPQSYHLDLYTPDGAFLSRTPGVAAGAIAVDLFRNIYTLNYERLAGAPRVEPSLSQWLPSSTAT